MRRVDLNCVLLVLLHSAFGHGNQDTGCHGNGTGVSDRQEVRIGLVGLVGRMLLILGDPEGG